MSMDTLPVSYKGYTIIPMPSADTGQLWFGGYEIRKGDTRISMRQGLHPGVFYSDAACIESIERAKIEIDNLAGAGDTVS
jgi:hypothetical protein